MARIFNIYFNYDDVMHHTVVSVRTTPFFTEYSLLNMSEDLLRHLPDNKIISKNQDHFIFPNTSEENTTPLMRSIIKALAEHMQEKQI